MNTKVRDIVLIFSVSFLLGLARSLIIQDIAIIKSTPNIVNIFSEELFDSPSFIDIKLSKELYDKGALFIDARDPSTFFSGHINNAINIPWENLTNEEITFLSEDILYNQIIITYCSGGDCTLSLDLADFMFDELGFERVLVFEGGYPKWIEKGYPIARIANNE
tara:strand:+ start:429 stop:920 length:492 start_codon:yes stop_codon:yes gene_type:complete